MIIKYFEQALCRMSLVFDFFGKLFIKAPKNNNEEYQIANMA